MDDEKPKENGNKPKSFWRVRHPKIAVSIILTIGFFSILIGLSSYSGLNNSIPEPSPSPPTSPPQPSPSPPIQQPTPGSPILPTSPPQPNPNAPPASISPPMVYSNPPSDVFFSIIIPIIALIIIAVIIFLFWRRKRPYGRLERQ